jgi:hypothetical protein
MDDPELIAHQKLLDLAAQVKGFGAHMPSPQRIMDRKDCVVLLYKSVVGSKTYRVTLRKFHWLVPIAGNLQWVIWIPTQVELTDCSESAGGYGGPSRKAIWPPKGAISTDSSIHPESTAIHS